LILAASSGSLSAIIRGQEMIARKIVLVVAAALLASTAAQAQTASDRAGELKVWREQCSDPDTDLRIAYIEAALDTKDTSIIRICARQSLESDDSDTRNLGLRAALASMEQIHFQVEMPALLASALDEAGDDEDKLKEIDRWYIKRDWQGMQTGLVFEIDKADLTKGTAVWYPLVNRSARYDRNVGKIAIVGDAVTWVGAANLANSDCTLTATLVAGPALQGEFLCSQGEPFPVTAKLL